MSYIDMDAIDRKAWDKLATEWRRVIFFINLSFLSGISGRFETD